MFVVPAQTGFEGNGYVHRVDNGFQDFGNQRLVLHQCAACLHIADFFGRTTHVYINHLRAQADVVTRGFRHLLRIAAGNLHGHNSALAFKIAAAQGFFGMAQARIAGQHFAYRPPCAKLAANPAERFVRNACHGGECDGVVNEIAADVHDVCAELKGLKLYNF